MDLGSDRGVDVDRMSASGTCWFPDYGVGPVLYFARVMSGSAC